MSKIKKTKIGIVGCGAIGEGVACFIEKNLKNQAVLVALADKDLEKAETLLEKLDRPTVIMGVDKLIRSVDLVIETASKEAAKYILQKAIAYKKDALILSVGAFIGNERIVAAAHKRGIKIYVPSGAICGVDGLGALSLGRVKSVSLITSKPPRGLIGAEYLRKKRINLDDLKEPKTVFEGGVGQATKYFPQNINVAATLMLSSGFKNVRVRIKADPNITRNIHRIEIETDEARVSVNVENVPSKINPKTSALAILSTQALLRKIFSSFKIGS